MSSELAFKLSSKEHREVQQQRNLEIIANSNRQPVVGDHNPVSQRQSILTVDPATCHWPIGDPQQDGFYLCGATTGAQAIYCVHHMEMAYAPASKSKRAA